MNDADFHKSLLVMWLQELGYKARSFPDNPSVQSATAGMTFFVSANEDSVQYRSGVVITQTPILFEDVNAFNADLRYVKAYFGKENNLIFEADFFLLFSSAQVKSEFERTLTLIEYGLAEFKKLAIGRVTAN